MRVKIDQIPDQPRLKTANVHTDDLQGPKPTMVQTDLRPDQPWSRSTRVKTVLGPTEPGSRLTMVQLCVVQTEKFFHAQWKNQRRPNESAPYQLFIFISLPLAAVEGPSGTDCGPFLQRRCL